MFDFKPGDYEYDEPELQGEEDITLFLSESEAYLIVLDVIGKNPPLQSLTPVQSQDVVREILALLQEASSNIVSQEGENAGDVDYATSGSIEDLHHLMNNWQMKLPYFVAFATINAVFIINKKKIFTVEEITASIVKSLSGLNAEENSLLGQDIFGDKPETIF